MASSQESNPPHAKKMAKLTAAKVKALARTGMHGDGAGLYLRVAYTGAKAWVYRATIDGRRREIGLGPYPAVALGEARTRATELRLAVSKGRNPLADKPTPPAAPTFRLAAEQVHAISRPRWRSQKHADDWWATLERHAFAELGDLPVDRIDRFAVLAVLTPIWTKTPETARRVRQRIRAVMRWAMAHGHIDGNPAGEVIDGALPAMPKIKAHLRALPTTRWPTRSASSRHPGRQRPPRPASASWCSRPPAADRPAARPGRRSTAWRGSGACPPPG